MTLLECPQSTRADAAPAPSNRRVAVRFPCRRGTSGCVAGTRDLVARSASIENLSVRGLALSLRRPLRRGARLLIQMTSAALDLAYDLSAHVTHATKQPDGKWLIGCAFARELTPTELQTLL
jgi:hypothetical protein